MKVSTQNNLLFSAIAAAGILGGIFWGIKNYVFYQKCIPATGIVVSVANSSYYSTKTHSRQYYSYPLIEFTATNGKKYRFYGSSSINMTGYDVDVLYDADNPGKAHEKSLTLWLYPLATFFTGLVFMYVMYSNGKIERQIKRDMEEDAKDMENME